MSSVSTRAKKDRLVEIEDTNQPAQAATLADSKAANLQVRNRITFGEAATVCINHDGSYTIDYVGDKKEHTSSDQVSSEHVMADRFCANDAQAGEQIEV